MSEEEIESMKKAMDLMMKNQDIPHQDMTIRLTEDQYNQLLELEKNSKGVK